MSTATVDSPAERQLPEWITSDTLYEIIDGEYVEKEPMSTLALKLATRIAGKINNYAIEEFGEATCELLVELPGLSRCRLPDVAYVSYMTWPKAKPVPEPNAWLVAPDLCIEVISPTDRLIAAKEKMAEYFQAGVKQVWWITPTLAQLEAYTGPTKSRIFASHEVVDCSAIIPGFQLNLAELL